MSKFKVLTLSLGLSLVVFSANALCISCGCSKNYQACVEKAELADSFSDTVDNEDGSFTYVGTVAECKQSRSDCHATGKIVTIRF